MRYTLVRVPTLSRRIDETIRFPQVGLLNGDYLVQDENRQDMGKARVDDGIISLFAIQSGLSHGEMTKIRDRLLRAITMDADAVRGNLSIQFQASGFDPMELKRFFERFGFREVGDLIMKRLSGSIRPPSTTEELTEGEVVSFDRSIPIQKQLNVLAHIGPRIPGDSRYNGDNRAEVCSYIEENQIAEFKKLSYVALYVLVTYAWTKGWKNLSSEGFAEWKKS